MDDPNEHKDERWALEETQPNGRLGILNVIIAGLALFSDGCNAQIIRYMEPLFSVLYKDSMSHTIKARLSNSYLIGEIFSMLFFGDLIDRIGCRTGVIAATASLIGHGCTWHDAAWVRPGTRVSCWSHRGTGH